MNAHGGRRIPNVRVDGRAHEVRRVFCIGRNYADHVREMGNAPPSAPVIFMKPPSSLVAAGCAIRFPSHGAELHHEAEIVVLIGGAGSGWARVAGVGLGLDLTLRDVQARLKQSGLPWEAAKAFESSAPIGDLVSPGHLPDPEALRFECRVNGELRQRGDSADMTRSVPELIEAIGSVWELAAGDLIFTGTPAGVGPLVPGDRVEVEGPGLGKFAWVIESARR